METQMIVEVKRSKVSEFFGQFAEKSFYWELAKSAIREVLKAAALALTGTITHYINQKFTGKSIPMETNTTQPGSSLTQRAFGSDYTTGYRPSTPVPVTTSPASFPGFGAR